MSIMLLLLLMSSVRGPTTRCLQTMQILSKFLLTMIQIYLAIHFKDYKHRLKKESSPCQMVAPTYLNSQSLREWRQLLAKRFAVKCTKSDIFKQMFPLNEKQRMGLRKHEKYAVCFCRAHKLCKSSIPVTQRILN